MSEIIRTTDYYKFRQMVGNRSISKRAENIKESIKRIGWVSNPIIVNQNMEIVDGQARFQALRELGMPIEYRMIPNLDIDDCRTLNKFNTDWKAIDFLDSFAAVGNHNYMRLKNLMETFGEHQLRLVLRAAGRSYDKEEFQEGNMILTDRDFGLAFRRLSTLSKFKPVLKRFGGRALVKYPAIFFIADRNDVDTDEMLRVLRICDPKDIYCDTALHFLESIQKVYNRNKMRKNRIYIAEDYKKERF